MADIIIINLRNSRIQYPYDVPCDRRTPVGNPFTGDREQDCDKYEQYFKDKLNSNDKQFHKYIRMLEQILHMYGKIRLFCWCAPLRCHTETIKAYLESVE